MTKIGEGNPGPQPSDQIYHKQLQDGIIRFENALSGYQVAKNPEEIEHLQAIMNQQMGLIRNAVQEIKRLGINKEGQRVQSDYEHYRADPSKENLTALQQDLSTLQDYNYTP